MTQLYPALIVDFPIKAGDFPVRFLYVYQMVPSGDQTWHFQNPRKYGFSSHGWFPQGNRVDLCHKWDAIWWGPGTSLNMSKLTPNSSVVMLVGGMVSPSGTVWAPGSLAGMIPEVFLACHVWKIQSAFATAF